MPIYAYKCDACGHAKDVLQKISDPPLTQCPACGAPAFRKQLTAAGFQLKGSGWYVTDFRGDAKASKDAKEAGNTSGGEAAATGKAPAADAAGSAGSTAKAVKESAATPASTTPPSGAGPASST